LHDTARRWPRLEPRTQDLQSQPVGDVLDLGQQRSQEVVPARLQRDRALAEHREELPVRELVAADQAEPLVVAHETEQIVRAYLRRSREEVGTVLGQRRVTHVADAVEQGQRALARAAGDASLAQIIDERRAMNLLDGHGAQRLNLRIAAARARDVAHLVFV
jgi:hypothetical protein